MGTGLGDQSVADAREGVNISSSVFVPGFQPPHGDADAPSPRAALNHSTKSEDSISLLLCGVTRTHHKPQCFCVLECAPNYQSNQECKKVGEMGLGRTWRRQGP